MSSVGLCLSWKTSPRQLERFSQQHVERMIYRLCEIVEDQAAAFAAGDMKAAEHQVQRMSGLALVVCLGTAGQKHLLEDFDLMAEHLPLESRDVKWLLSERLDEYVEAQMQAIRRDDLNALQSSIESANRYALLLAQAEHLVALLSTAVPATPLP